MPWARSLGYSFGSNLGLKLVISCYFGGRLLEQSSNDFWNTFGDMSEVISRQTSNLKLGRFFERPFVAPGKHFGKLPACLGALLGALVFQSYCKK